MYKNKKIVAIIPARGGSKGIPKKNIKILAGKPLIVYSIEASLKCKNINRTIVSTDDKEIAEISKRYGAEVIERPRELSKDDTPTILAIRHVVNHLKREENYRTDVVVILQPTSPLREAADIDDAIEKFLKTCPDLVVSVSEAKHHPFWSFKTQEDKLVPFVKDGFKITRRQDLPKIYVPNGAIYVISKETIEKDNFFEGDTRAITMSEDRSIDIDSMLDFKIAESLIKERNKIEKNKNS